jgi:arylsulfatase A-like enzyme
MFTNMHASPVCAPSRAMLITGTDSHLAGVANLPEMLPDEYQTKPGYGGELNERVQTIATRLKEANYNTYATGKWHLGHNERTLPTKRGFDRSYILGGSGASNYDSRGYLPQKPHAHWYADGKEVELPEDFYSSKTYIDKTISFHEEEQNKDNPFFAYIAFQAIHTPVQAPKEYVDHYMKIYEQGWDKMRQNRFEKAKQMGLIPQNAQLNEKDIPVAKKWDALSAKEQKQYATSMAVTAGMLEAMDYHIGRYIEYLSKKGLLENTVFIVTSDNGPDGGDYKLAIPWAIKNGYHRDFENKGGKGFYGYMGTGFANAVSSPLSFFKYYTGEGGVRVPLIISGMNIPKNTSSDEFSFITDIAPTIYDMAGISSSANKGYASVTGKSLFHHMSDPSVPVYEKNEGVGIEAASSSAYFMNGYKIVKNNIPDGDNQWHLHHIESDPGEVNDIANQEPELFRKMLAAYSAYEKK